MSKKWLENKKKLLLAIVTGVVIVAGVVVVSSLNRKTAEPDKKQESVAGEDTPNEDGLEVIEDIESIPEGTGGKEDSTSVPEVWDKEDNNNETSTKKDDTKKDDVTSADTPSDDKGESENDIMSDEKSWCELF